MKKSILIITLGNREIYLDKNLLSEEIKEKLSTAGYKFDNSQTHNSPTKLNLRMLGHILSENFEKDSSLREAISLSIINPTIEMLCKENVEIVRIYLIATNQEKNDGDFHKTDTITIANFLSKYCLPWILKNKYNFSVLPSIENIILTVPPNDYDAVLTELRKELERIRDDIEKDNIKKVYAHATGGTPQLAFGLIINSVRLFGEKVVMVYKSESTEESKKINIAKHILEDYERRALIRLVNRYDFDAIVRHEGYKREIRAIAKCASYRLNFDFETYDKLLKQNVSLLREFKVWENLNEDAVQILNKEPSSLFSELYWNAYIKWERDECPDYIQRIWRILEGILHLEVSSIVGCEWNKIDNIKTKFEKWVKGDGQDFLDYTTREEAKFREKHGLSYITGNQMPCTVHSMTALLDYLSFSNRPLEHQKREKYKKIVKIQLSMRKFADLRNKCFSVHGFEPVSKRKIEELENKTKCKIRDEIDKLLKTVGIQLKPNYYDIFKNIILKLGDAQI